MDHSHSTFESIVQKESKFRQFGLKKWKKVHLQISQKVNQSGIRDTK